MESGSKKRHEEEITLRGKKKNTQRVENRYEGKHQSMHIPASILAFLRNVQVIIQVKAGLFEVCERVLKREHCEESCASKYESKNKLIRSQENGQNKSGLKGPKVLKKQKGQ